MPRSPSERSDRASFTPGNAAGGSPNAADIGEVTVLLRAWAEGNEEARDRLAPIVYAQLHRLARSYMRGERAGHTLQASAVVNEAYLRLIDQTRVQWQNRAHFFAVAAVAMRRILVDYARRRNQKRGKGAHYVEFDEAVVSTEPSTDYVALDDALNALARFDARKARVVELRFFGGLSVDESAEVLQVSPVTVMRDWRSAKAWLYRELTGRSADGSGTLEPRR